MIEQSTVWIDEPSKVKPRPPRHFSEIDCPCCKRKVSAANLTAIIAYYRVSKQQARILEAVWKGEGRAVTTEKIFSAMYADDLDGGPRPTVMYSNLKYSLFKLRRVLKGSGVSIEAIGYRRGFRLVLGEK